MSNDTAKKLKEKLGRGLKLDEPLAQHVTFKIGGPATYFFAPKNNAEFVAALKISDELKLPRFILGGGSNLLIADQGIDGFVIKPENQNFNLDGPTVYAESGVIVTALLEATLKAELTGWAWAAGLPGTIGGAIRGNAGAYGAGMNDITRWVEVYYQGRVKRLSNQEMKFSYRHSIAKEEPMIIIAAELQLQTGDIVKEREQVDAYNQRRRDTQPLEYPNSGCIFKNINLADVQIDRPRVIRGLDVSEEEYNEKTKYGKIPVSFILDRLNLKGERIGDAQVSDRHAAFIVNVGQATAEDVIILISKIKMKVRDTLGIQLQEEVQLVGF